MPRAYLAGPDVFHRDAVAIGLAKSAICAAHGLDGVFPIDAGKAPAPEPETVMDAVGRGVAWDVLRALCTPPTPPQAPPTARTIYTGNVARIQGASCVIANLSPFRGPSADAGTVFEVGYAVACGIPVIAYSCDPRPYRVRVGGPPRDTLGMEVEDFDLPDNLMIALALADACVVPPTPLPLEASCTDMALFARAVTRAASHVRGDDPLWAPPSTTAGAASA